MILAYNNSGYEFQKTKGMQKYDDNKRTENT